MRDNGAIKVSRNVKILANKINRYISEYQTKNSESPSVEDLAKEFSVSPEEVAIAIDSARMPLSIFDKFDDEDEGKELIDKLPYFDNEEKLIDKIHLAKIIEGLSERERKIVTLRYFRDKTQTEIAEALGVSQVQVSRLETKILEKIREKFN